MIYYMCKYTPLEIFAGFGERTQRLAPMGDSFEAAESLGHPNMCGYGKGILEAAQNPEVQGLVLVSCCDVVKRIYDILKRQGKQRFLYLLDLPHKTGAAEERYMEGQIRGLISAYAAYSGRQFDAAAVLSQWPSAAGCGMCGTVKTESQRKNSREHVESEQAYISLQGAHSREEFPEMIRRVTGISVRDDTCTGNRNVELPEEIFAACRREKQNGTESETGVENILIRAYAHALLHQMPCMRMADVKSRGELGRNSLGIVYHTMKFCDYYGFEYAALKKNSEKPILKIETDGTGQNSGQISTRLEAFAESLHLKTERKSMSGTGNYTAGVDSGSSSTDAVILDQNGKIAGWAIVSTGAGASSGAKKALDEALRKAHLSREDLRGIVSTGYGRETIGIGDASVTEITCHARGAHYLDPEVRTVIDIGGQDSKVIRIDENGTVLSFVMNDKCAAGTGRFLEMMAKTMELSMEDMSRIGLKWKNETQISSMCTVFAESEVVSLIARNTATADIIHGLNVSVANRTAGLVKRVHGEGAYMMTGGVARNRGIVEALSGRIGEKIRVSEYAQLCGAIGAALIAAE
ncbi:MAG: acyl-CoA dehydratase activase [Eubacterium sp.]|nr:acyl-CoA dehydratase activase [Eubacterium sp.]